MVYDSYAECLVKRKTPACAPAVKALLAAGIVLSAGSIFFIGLYGFAALVLLCAAVPYVLGRMNVEYEYLAAEQQFSVDRILNKSRRKHETEYSMEEILAIAPEHSGTIKDLEHRIGKVSDFSSGNPEGRRYALVGQKNGVCEKVIFEPDEQMLRCLKNAAPRKFSEY